MPVVDPRPEFDDFADKPKFPGSKDARSNWLGFLRLPADLLINALKIHTGPGMLRLKHQFKFFARGMISPRLTRNWLDLWQSPTLAPLIQSHPRVLMKLQRPYLRRALGAEGRWQILRQHYCFASKYFPAAAFREIAASPGAMLAEIQAADAGLFSVRLTYHNLFEKEGELSLVFYDEHRQARVFALSFCVPLCRPGRREIFIGGLQGFKGANSREYIVAITRGMSGLRPKALLWFALQQVAALWDIGSIHAVSNETRNPGRHRTGIRADYNQFWLECGARLETDGNFTLPVTFTPRELTTIKPNKRPMYRRRYAMLSSVGEAIRQSLNRLTGHDAAVSCTACSRCAIIGE